MIDEYVKAWDRLGRAMGAAGEVADVVARRNIEVWTTIASNLRQGKYSADDRAADTARALSAGLDNARDMWTVLRSIAGNQSAAGPPLPTVCLFFQRNAAGGQVLTGQPEFPAPSRLQKDKPVPHAQLVGPDADSIAKLEKCLRAEYTDDCRIVIVPRGTPTLAPGLYQGLLYVDLDDRPQPVALLWAVVKP